MVICLERGADDLHMVQLMPLPSHHLLHQQNPEWFIFLVPAYPGCPGKRPLSGCSSSSSSSSSLLRSRCEKKIKANPCSHGERLLKQRSVNKPVYQSRISRCNAGSCRVCVQFLLCVLPDQSRLCCSCCAS